MVPAGSGSQHCLMYLCSMISSGSGCLQTCCFGQEGELEAFSKVRPWSVFPSPSWSHDFTWKHQAGLGKVLLFLFTAATRTTQTGPIRYGLRELLSHSTDLLCWKRSVLEQFSECDRGILEGRGMPSPPPARRKLIQSIYFMRDVCVQPIAQPRLRLSSMTLFVQIIIIVSILQATKNSNENQHISDFVNKLHPLLLKAGSAHTPWHHCLVLGHACSCWRQQDLVKTPFLSAAQLPAMPPTQINHQTPGLAKNRHRALMAIAASVAELSISAAEITTGTHSQLSQFIITGNFLLLTSLKPVAVMSSRSEDTGAHSLWERAPSCLTSALLILI